MPEQGGLNRLNDVLQYPAINAPKDVSSDSANQSKLQGRIELKDILFGYNRLEKPLLEGFNLTLEPGRQIALTGASGSGKSTLVSLIADLYQPWAGTISFDGLSSSEIPPAVLNGSLAVVSQTMSLFSGSIRDNLTLWDRAIPETTILQAAKDACIHQRIMECADDYNTLVDEGGTNFSGGERQRLEIARVLIHDPSILILDEATSALDEPTEKQILANIRRRGCACLIIF